MSEIGGGIGQLDEDSFNQPLSNFSSPNLSFQTCPVGRP